MGITLLALLCMPLSIQEQERSQPGTFPSVPDAQGHWRRETRIWEHVLRIQNEQLWELR